MVDGEGPSGGGGGIDMMGDEFFDPNAEYDHPKIVETMAEAKRREQGLPVKLKRPTIHVDHTGKHEQVMQPSAQRAPQVPSPPADAIISTVVVPNAQMKLAQTLQELEDLLVPHMQTKDATIYGLLCVPRCLWWVLLRGLWPVFVHLLPMTTTILRRSNNVRLPR